MSKMGLPGGPSGKELACQCRRHKRLRFDPWVREIPWRRAWQPTLVFLPGESQGQRNLESYSPWNHSQTWLKQLSKHTLSTLDKNSTFTLNGETWKRMFLSSPPPPSTKKTTKKTKNWGGDKKQYTKLQLLLSPSDSWGFKTVRPGLNFKEW